jgi:2-octaprenyl-6-methoxyphenol hydroxylase
MLDSPGDFHCARMGQGSPGLSVAVVGAGPVGLALAVYAALRWPQARVTTFDARAEGLDVSSDPRTLALSLGSVQALQRVGCWSAAHATAIEQVHVSEWVPPPSVSGRHRVPASDPAVRFKAQEQGGANQLGAVVSYGALMRQLQARWRGLCAQQPERLKACFGHRVLHADGASRLGAALQTQVLSPDASGEAAAEHTQNFDLIVMAEGGVFKPDAPLSQPNASSLLSQGRDLRCDYHQNAWVGEVEVAQEMNGVAFERFTPEGPVALLPVGPRRAALVWCVAQAHDTLESCTPAELQGRLQALVHPDVGAVTHVGPLKCFPLGLRAQTRLVNGRVLRLGNAAQTLHPVAGQGFNLGLRDAWALVHAGLDAPSLDAALARLEWQRAPDRWALIATTDFLARSFTWRMPGVPTLRSLALSGLSRSRWARKALGQPLMFGWL